jgi:DNA-binding CsgD family transcriptional regulator
MGIKVDRGERSLRLIGSPRKTGAGSILTRYEVRVLERVLLGESNKEIARKLGCSVKNVEYHVSNILRRTGVQTRLKLVATMARSN